jgi:hypothetical protein
MSKLGSSTLVIEDLARRRIPIAGSKPDMTATHLAELGRAGLEQRALEFDEVFVIELDLQIESAGRAGRA